MFDYFGIFVFQNLFGVQFHKNKGRSGLKPLAPGRFNVLVLSKSRDKIARQQGIVSRSNNPNTVILQVLIVCRFNAFVFINHTIKSCDGGSTG